MSKSPLQIVLVITGGIAAYKALELIRLLRKQDITVIPVMTHYAKKFITPLSVKVLAEHPVYSEFDDLEEGYGMGHIELTRRADLVVVCPASADILAAAASGFAGSLASCLLLASQQKIVMFPAMNPTMWANPAVIANVDTLKSRGIEVVTPAFGMAACQEEGVGRLPEPDLIFAHIKTHLHTQQASSQSLGISSTGQVLSPLPSLSEEKNQEEQQEQKAKNGLSGYHILITAGPTRESLDPVRYLSNHSSGLQGFALAQAARDYGAKVTLVTGPTALSPPDDEGIKVIAVQSAGQMLAACEQTLPVDVMIACAAVCDVQLEQVPTKKVPKDEIDWQFKRTPDIVAMMAKSEKRPSLVIGFSAETGAYQDMIKKAEQKRIQKQCDWIVANDFTTAMGQDSNEATLLTANRETEKWSRMKKQDLAICLMEKIAQKMVGP